MKALLAITALTFMLSPGPAVASPALPTPTGSQPVGVSSVYLKDTSRPDTWHPEVPYRELMVSLFYPASSARGQNKQFMTETEAQAVLDEAGLTTLSAAAIAATRTDAVVDARPAGRRHPLVVLSPGFKRPRAELMSLSEDLASHGYVVALVDHTYENVATTFPDGHVTGCDACGSYDQAFWDKLEAGRGRDVSFVLDRLTRSRWSGLIDPHRIGMAGHSVGGASATVAMVADQRIKAGIDMDGTTTTPLTTDLSRPFMFFGRANMYTPGTGDESDSWQHDWAHLTGWKRWLVVAGMQHASFTDFGLVAEALGVDAGADTPATRGSAITRAYVRAFFDEHLLGRRQPLLAHPSPRYPEVAFCE
jgi:dienelactone hydrolase